jgi:hypothetical protein
VRRGGGGGAAGVRRQGCRGVQKEHSRYRKGAAGDAAGMWRGVRRGCGGVRRGAEGCGGVRRGAAGAAGCGGACQCKCVGKTKESSSTRASQRKRRATKAAEALTCLVRVGDGVRFRVG